MHCFYSVHLPVLEITGTVLISAWGTSRAWMPHQTPASTDAISGREAAVDGVASPAGGVLPSSLKAVQGTMCQKQFS